MNTAESLIRLSDIANCVSGDIHTIHLNAKGKEFDTLHAEVTKTYYEELDNDYDEFAEKAGMVAGTVLPNKCDSKVRIGYNSWEPMLIDRDNGFSTVGMILTDYVEALTEAFNEFNKEQGAIEIGVANFLQTRIEYWSKETYYFNQRRIMP